MAALDAPLAIGPPNWSGADPLWGPEADIKLVGSSMSPLHILCDAVQLF